MAVLLCRENVLTYFSTLRYFLDLHFALEQSNFIVGMGDVIRYAMNNERPKLLKFQWSFI